MTTGSSSSLARAFACSALILSVVCLGSISPAVAAGPAGPPLVQDPKAPKIWLGESHPLSVNHVGQAAPSMSGAQPLSMVSADFDSDGVQDLVAGYSTPSGGVVAWHRGNLDAFAPQSEASFQAIGRGEFPSPFLSEVQTFAVPVNPDFIAAGNFTGQGHQDVAVAAKGGKTLFVFANDGKGNFGPPQTVSLAGGITALAAGRFGHTDTLIAGGARSLAVYVHTPRGLTALASYAVSGPVSNILFGDFGDDGLDVAFLSAGKIRILRSSTMQVATVDLPVTVRAFALGSFIYDRSYGQQIALVAPDGSVRIAARNEFDPRVYTVEEFQAIRRAKINRQPAPAFVPLPSFPANGWKIVESFPGAAALGASQTPLIFRTRISINGADDVMVLNAFSRQLALISHEDGRPGAQTFQSGQLSLRPYSGTPIAALPMRLNVDGRLGVMALHSNEAAPSQMAPIPDPTFFVNTDNDPTPTSPIANACTCTTDSSCFTNLTSSCSLREAILKANGDTIMLQAGHTYSLTRGRVTASPDYTGDHGALYVNNTATIVGGNQNTTIIQWGTLTSGNTVDMVMAVNQDINPLTNATASLSNLTIQNGVNHGTTATFDGDGGCMEFDTGSAGTATLSLTNVTLKSCSTLQGGGGGLVIFNSVTPAGAGGVTISNSIIQGNSVVSMGAAGNGGGIAIAQDAHMTMTASQVLNNSAVQQCNPTCGLGDGGGIVAFAPQNVNAATGETFVHSSTISGNKSAGFGGGIWSGGSISIDQGTVISGNIAGTDGTTDTAHANQEGGGFYSNPAASCPLVSTCTTTLSKVTITGNKATGNGGGISHGNNSPNTTGSLTMSFSRLAGNTTSGGSGSNLSNNNATATVTDNWWGTNNASSTINTISGTTTFDPFIVLTHTASPNAINAGQSTTLTASVIQDNHGAGILVGNLDVLLGLPITFNNAVNGSLSNQQATIQNTGTATATFTASGGPGSADAVVDNATATATISVPSPPTIIKSFGATSIPLNGTTSLGFTITNPNPGNSLNGIGFADTLPAGLIISTPSGLTGSCGGGTITAAQNTNIIGLSGASLAASGSCTFSVNVTGTGAGGQNNITGNVTSTEGGTGGVATASIPVVAPPSIAKAFNPSTIPLNATTSLTFTITNPAGNTVPENGVAFSDTLPTGLVVSTPNGLTNNCGGTPTATAGSTGISLTGGSIAVNTSCTVVVNITGTASGQYTNISGAVSSTNGGTGNTASAALTVATPQTSTKQFTLHQIALNGTTTLTINITNPNTSVALTGIAFTDSLPAGLVVAPTPNGSNTCGGTFNPVAGASSASLSGGTLAANASCAAKVDVQGTTAGVKNNSVIVNSTEAGAGTPSSDSLTVVAPPTVQKSFADPSVALNFATTTMSFQVNNPNGVGLTGIGFTDNVPAGLQLASTTVTGSCGSGTISAVIGPPSSVALAGGTLAASGSCTFSVTVKGTAAGAQNNTTGQITSAEGGTGTTSNTATLKVDGPPSIAKAFNPTGIQPNGVSTLTITITNPAANPDPAQGVAFTDNFPANLVVATPNNLSNNCGGTATATAGSTSLSLTGGSIPVNTSCAVSVSVTATPTGSYLNSSGPVSSTNGGTGGGGSANLFVAFPPTINKSFVPNSTVQGGTSLVSFTINNNNSNSTPPNSDVTLTGISFTDALPAGLQVAAIPNVSNDCGGTLTANPGSTSITLTGGSVAPAVPLIPPRRAASRSRLLPLQPIADGACFVSVKVQATATGTLNNTTGPISANESGPGPGSNTASLTVAPPPNPPTVSKAFGAATIQLTATTSLTFTITNPNASATLENISLNDPLPAGLAVASPNGLAGSCVTSNEGLVTATPGTQSISLTGVSLPGAGSCSYTVNVTGIGVGAQNNTTGNITASFNDGTGTFVPITGGTASASINVVTPILAITKTHTGDFSQRQVGATYTITVSNTGNAPTLGTVTVTENPPAGLVVTGFSGTNWSCNVGLATCSRSDPLNPGSSYDVLTLTVNVLPNAPASVTNSVTVSGGGAPSPATANDPTTVIKVGPPIVITPDPNSNTVVVAAGMAANFTFTVDAGQINPPPVVITFSCSGLPVGTACNFNPQGEAQSVTQVTMTVTTLGRNNSGALLPFGGDRTPVYAVLLPILGLVGISLAGRRGRKTRLRLAVAIIALMVFLALSGCGGNPLVTPPGTYSITVTGTTTTPSGNVSGTATVTLRVL